ncbi:MAG: MFS transporter [Candidatus Moraniibacteriota bacterium]|nr:MAG: MFS transporter [Candidatus Moranbacteria bacterium]
MHTRSVASNIWKIAALRALRSFMLIIPVLVLFLQENGLSLSEVFLLQSLFSVALLLFEIPTGYLSDRFGRRNSVIFGCTFGIVGHWVYAFGTGFWDFLLAETLLGFGASFLSGTESALLFDSLVEMDQVKEHKRIEGRNTSLGMLSEAVASILGGVLALISLRFPLYCEAVMMLALIPVALSIVEPRRERLVAISSPIKDMFRLTKYALHDHVEIRWLCLYSAAVGASTLTMVWLTQPYFKAAGLPLSFFGIVWAVFQMIGASCSWHAHAIEQRLGRHGSLVFLVALPAFGYFVLGLSGSLAVGGVIACFYITRGVHGPILSDYINSLVASEIRATILSAKNLLARLLFSIVGPVVGWVHDSLSLSMALIGSGCFFLLLGSLALFGITRSKKPG